VKKNGSPSYEDQYNVDRKKNEKYIVAADDQYDLGKVGNKFGKDLV
jgi:hypothetical protein